MSIITIKAVGEKDLVFNTLQKLEATEDINLSKYDDKKVISYEIKFKEDIDFKDVSDMRDVTEENVEELIISLK